jgi:hypothetical protein
VAGHREYDAVVALFLEPLGGIGRKDWQIA